MREYSQAQVMLSLALLSYRGFWNPGKRNRNPMTMAINQGLRSLEPLSDDWRIVWGPGTYRYLGAVFDSSMMYVVQHTRDPARYVIVVRGTNPVALLDWLLGDFLHHRQVPWYQCCAGYESAAAVSLSSALGLQILLSMRDDVAAAPGVTAPELSVAGQGKETGLVRKLKRYQQQWGFAGKVAGGMFARLGTLRRMDDLEKRLNLRQQMVELLDDCFEDSGREAPVAILMPGAARAQEDQGQGVGLLALLRELAARHGEALDLTVTGHSKGGALAPVLALFLADTQAGTSAVPLSYRWNSGPAATISCYAFAGPTPGNTAFAAHFNQRLGRTFYRYANKLDLVTYAWQSDELLKIANLYGDKLPAPRGLEKLLGQMSAEVKELDYCQLGRDYDEPGFVKNRTERHVIQFAPLTAAAAPVFALEAAHQHIGGYLDVLGLNRFFTVPEVMGLRG